jgi:putative ABC transport system substrate-binding protein
LSKDEMRKTDVRSQTSEVSKTGARCPLLIAPKVALGGRFSLLRLISDLRLLISGSCVLLIALCSSAGAQSPKKVFRVGFLGAASASANAARIDALRLGLRELGYVEGNNILIEYRYADGNRDRLPTLAAELVRLKVDAIVSGGAAATGPARQATASIPIIMTNDPDPVASGYVAGLARPGGNVTGLSTLTSELAGKRLELVKEMVPRLSRIAVLGVTTNPGNDEALKETDLAARALKVQLQYLDVPGPKSVETAFVEASKGRADAVLLLSGSVFVLQRKQIAALAVKSRLPTIHYRREFVEDGGLMSYATSLTDLSRRAATYVDKILKGAKPADLPVEQPTKFELVINLKAANEIGLTIPQRVLLKADKVIK